MELLALSVSVGMALHISAACGTSAIDIPSPDAVNLYVQAAPLTPLRIQNYFLLSPSSFLLFSFGALFSFLTIQKGLPKQSFLNVAMDQTQPWATMALATFRKPAMFAPRT